MFDRMMQDIVTNAGYYAAGVVFLVITLLAFGPAIMRKIKHKRRRDKGWVVIDEHGTHDFAGTEKAKLFQIVGVKNTCPDCRQHGFYEGPSGGMSTNIFCMNRDCRSGFNVTSFGGGVGTCERIGKGDLDRYPKEPSPPVTGTVRA
jgi:hypothetical protein